MKTLTFALLGLGMLGLGVSADDQAGPARSSSVPRVAPSTQPPPATPPPRMVTAHRPVEQRLPPESQTAMVKEYCAGCHNDRARSGGLSLASFDAARVVDAAEVTERMIRKVRAGMMPPAGAKHPGGPALSVLAQALEARLDEAAALNPNPGRRVFQRLNRAEYSRAMRDLLDIDVDVTALLPADTVSHGFDNIADSQSFSPTLMEGYLNAAIKISSAALGDPTASPSEATYKVPRTASQMRQVEGAPWGTRGGVSVVHTFPADGEYTFRVMLHGVPTGELYGANTRGEQVEVSINGARMALLDINHRMTETGPNGLSLVTPRLHVKAGPQRVSAVFIERSEGPIDDLLILPEHTLADTFMGDGYGVTTLPHLRDLSITGPFSVTGVSDTPSRRKIFTCRPTSAGDEPACAMAILGKLAGQAYRRSASESDVTALMKFYTEGRKDGGFEAGIRFALQALLASPHFLLRVEEPPPTTPRSGQNYRIGEMSLAARLSYFIWNAAPDADLLKAAGAGRLKTAAGLEAEVRRMLADPRAEALSTRFAAQWLRLQDVDKIRPDALLYASWDHTLAESFKRETELLFASIVREDRNVLDLLSADYTFLNERIARHYGVPNVTGAHFRRVALGPAFDARRGVLGHGSMLLLTSVADRTSPVQRGKWIMEVLLGSPPPPPPPNVPALEDTKAVAQGGKTLSTRERMEEHRRNPACSSCHRVIDPLGLALENFDVTGAWRIRDNGVDVDAQGVLYDGTGINGPQGLRDALLARPEPLLRNFTENLMAYAIGRRIEYFDQPAIRGTVRQAATTGNTFSSFVLGVVNSAAFQMSRAESGRTTDSVQ